MRYHYTPQETAFPVCVEIAAFFSKSDISIPLNNIYYDITYMGILRRDPNGSTSVKQ